MERRRVDLVHRVLRVDLLRRRVAVPAVRLRVRERLRGPAGGVAEDLEHLGLTVDRERLVARREVEDPALAALERHAAAEDVAALVPADEHDVRLGRDAEG